MFEGNPPLINSSAPVAAATSSPKKIWAQLLDIFKLEFASRVNEVGFEIIPEFYLLG